MYGVIRSWALRQAGPLKKVSGPDVLLIANLSLRGNLVQIPRPLLNYRIGRPAETRKEQRRRVLNALAPMAHSPWPLYARTVREYMRAAREAPIGQLQKVMLAVNVALWLGVRLVRRLTS